MIIRRVSPMSAAKTGGMLYALLGLLYGVIFALISFTGMGALAGAGAEGMGMLGPIFGVGAIVILPIVLGIFGFIFMAIAAAFYNIAAKLAGGLEIQVDP